MKHCFKTFYSFEKTKESVGFLFSLKNIEHNAEYWRSA